MRVQINPEPGPTGLARKVFHPKTKKPFPSGPFDLSDKDLRDPAVLRLLPPPGEPGGVAGGVMADLVPVAPAEGRVEKAPTEGRDPNPARGGTSRAERKTSRGAADTVDAE